MPLAFEALTIRSASSQSNWPFFCGSMKRHWNSVFCQPKPASLSLPISRSVVFWLPQTNTFIPYSGLLARCAVLAAGGPLAAAAAGFGAGWAAAAAGFVGLAAAAGAAGAAGAAAVVW